MGSRYEVEVTVASARDLKNVNWRNGDLKPYAVLWVDSGAARVSTRVDLDNGECPSWDEKVLVPLPPSSRVQDAVLYVDVVHANAAEGVKPLVGSARLPLRDVVDDAGVGGKASRNLRLKRPSGRPQGRLDVRVTVREPSRYYDGNQAGYPAPAGYPQPGGAYGSSRDMYGSAAAGGYGAGAGGYGAAYAAAPPAGYPAYGAAQPPQAAYGSAPAYGAAPPVQAGYGSAQPAYGASTTTAYVEPAKKKGMGMGAGLAVGAAAGVLGGLALAGGASYLEDKFEDHVAERVEEDQYGGGGGYDDYGGDDDY
ncbi:protein SRC2 homolog [Lolium rigidum]|uniref:protein SRC2 homolog n=1 Tax=Lolium rigidum TaxID=89674 RepID=UPI001F5D9F77|nr:protein SRC2 homolog [Lolium rigidum]